MMKKLLNEISYAGIDTRAMSLQRTTLEASPQSVPVVSVEGILMDPQRHWSSMHSDSLPSPCTVGEIADSSGEWTAIAEDQNGDFSRYLVFSDYAGYAPIFYSLVPGKAVVLSGSFSGAVQGIRAFGSNTTLNLGNYLTLITGRARTFETLIASETMANEIHILRPGEAISIDHQTVKIIDRDLLSPAATRSNYDDVLTASVEYTSNTIANVLSKNMDAVPLITLTGGVDSRLVLALLSTTEYLSAFRVWSIDPRKRKDPNQRRVFTADVEISNQIRKCYGLSWMSDWKREKVSASLMETLARHQSYYSNYFFQYYTAKHIQLEKDPIFTLRGGGGEILRGSSNARVSNNRYDEYVAAGGELEDVNWAAGHLLERSFLTNELRPISEDYLAKQLSSENPSSLREKLDTYYKDHRNRAHFGHHRMSEGKKDRILQVLSNPYMQRLVDLADYDYASKNGIVLDLFNSTEPDLRKFPFESEAAHKELHLPPTTPFNYADRDSWIADFDAIERRSKAYTFREFCEPGHRGEDIRSDTRGQGIAFISHGFRIIEQLVPSDLRRAVELQHERVLTRLNNKQIPLGKFMAIVASTTDIVAPMGLDSARHFFTAHGVGSSIPPKNLLHDAAEPYRALLPGK